MQRVAPTFALCEQQNQCIITGWPQWMLLKYKMCHVLIIPRNQSDCKFGLYSPVNLVKTNQLGVDKGHFCSHFNFQTKLLPINYFGSPPRTLHLTFYLFPTSQLSLFLLPFCTDFFLLFFPVSFSSILLPLLLVFLLYFAFSFGS